MRSMAIRNNSNHPTVSEFKKTHDHHSNNEEEEEEDHIELEAPEITKTCSSEAAAVKATSPTHRRVERTTTAEENGRERLKRHRGEMAGRVWIPDIWGQEDLLKDWIDCNAFDASLINSSIMSARTALMQERAPANSRPVLRIENRC